MYNPRPDDAVLGNNQAPNTQYNAVVLGGIEGAYSRLNSTSLPVKLEALVSALKYNEEGLQLIQKFLQQQTDPSVKWIASNWIWLHASDAARVQLTKYISCLKHISKELMEVILTIMVTDVTDRSVAPLQTLLNKIEKRHINKISIGNLIGNLSVRYKELGDFYYSRLEQGQLSKRLSKVVVIAYQEAIVYGKNSPQLPYLLNKRGLAYYYLRDYQAAIQDYNQAIKINPNYAWAYNDRGLAYENLRDYQAAIQDYNQAIKINPTHVDAYIHRGCAYKNLGDYQAAIEDYNQAIIINPNYADTYHNRGLAYENLGDYQAAIEDYNQAIIINHNNADTYHNRGLVYYNLVELSSCA